MGITEYLNLKKDPSTSNDKKSQKQKKDEEMLHQNEKEEKEILDPLPESSIDAPNEMQKEQDNSKEAEHESIGPPLNPENINEKDPLETNKGPIGLDIGTTNIVVAQKDGAGIKSSIQLNAFYTLRYSSLTKEALVRDKIMFFQKEKQLYILGHSAEDFANIYENTARRPVKSGMLNPKENESENVIKAIVNHLIKTPQKEGQKVCFSVPAEPLDNHDSSLVYHESVIKDHLKSLGYTPIALNEGMAIILSELSSNNFTGVGISMGGGMCNICFSYLTVPVVTYSIQKGGDYIDSMVGQSVGKSPIKIKQIKEKELDLSIEPRNRIETGLHVYYDDLFSTLADSLQKVIGMSENIPRLPKAVPFALGGGTVLPRGSKEKFEKALKGIRLPFKISDVILAEGPLYATARGALMMARLDE